MKLLWTNKAFLLLCVGLTCLYYVITGIQYWISDYMITVLKQDETIVFTTFTFDTITGPVFGVIIGGNVTTKLGGYNAKKALILTLALCFFCFGVSAPIPFVNNFWVFNTFLWLLLFTGGFVLPCLTGIMLNTVDKELKTTANSIANLCYNLFGYLPSPFVYGAISDIGEGGNDKLSILALMLVPIVCLVCISQAARIIIRDDILHYK